MGKWVSSKGPLMYLKVRFGNYASASCFYNLYGNKQYTKNDLKSALPIKIQFSYQISFCFH